MSIINSNHTKDDNLDYIQKLTNYISRYKKVEIKEDGNV